MKTYDKLSQRISKLASGIDVLVVEDEPILLDSVRRLFEHFFRLVQTASNGKEGLDMALNHHFGLVVTDISMPVMDGITMIKKIRETKHDQAIMILSAHTDADYLLSAIDLNVYGFLLKPFTIETCLQTLEHALEKIAFQQSFKEKYQHERLNAFKYYQLLEQYKTAVDESTIVSKTNIHGQITYVNLPFCKISGYSKEELIGQNHRIIRHPDMPDSFFASLWGTITQKLPFSGIIKNRAKDGSHYYVKTNIFPILDEKREIVEFFSIRQDVTAEVTEAEHEKYLSDLKDEFLRNLSHEIRTPLNHIIGMGNLLKKKISDPTYIDYLNVILDGGKQINNLTHRLLLLESLNSGDYKVSLQDGSLYTNFSEMRRYYQNLEISHKFVFGWNIDESLMSVVKCDYHAIRTIVDELLDNAFKFTLPNCRIDVRMHYSDDKKFIFTIQNRSDEIPSDRLSQIYEAFVQGDGSMTRKSEGIGIGLSIVSKLVNLLHGTISYEYIDHESSFFKVTLPIGLI